MADGTGQRPIPVKIFKQTSDLVVNNSTTFVNTEIAIPVKAGRSYFIQLIGFTNSGATPDSKLIWTIPTNDFNGWDNLGGGGALNAMTTQQTETGAGADEADLYYAFITPTADGILQLQFAQQTANASNTVFKAGSVAEVTES